MIVGCPDCGTRYAIEETVLAADGKRRLRCANCGHLWEHAPAASDSGTAAAPPLVATAAGEPVAVPPPLVVAAPESKTETDAAPPLGAPDPLSRPSVSAEPPPRPRHRIAWAAGIGVLALAAVLALVAYLGRDRIERLVPASKALYAAAWPRPAPGAGLKVTVTPMRRADAVVVAGDIVNGAATARLVPRLRLTLFDDKKVDLVSKVIDPPVARLSPGAKTHFNATFEHPAATAARVDVTFATD